MVLSWGLYLDDVIIGAWVVTLLFGYGRTLLEVKEFAVWFVCYRLLCDCDVAFYDCLRCKFLVWGGFKWICHDQLISIYSVIMWLIRYEFVVVIT